jgi:hypothetical protein
MIFFSGGLIGGMAFGESSEDEMPETLGDLDEEEEQKHEERHDMMSQDVYRALCRKQVCLNDETRPVHNYVGCTRCDNRWCHMQNEVHDRAECGSVPNLGRGKGGAHFDGVGYLRGGQRLGGGGYQGNHQGGGGYQGGNQGGGHFQGGSYPQGGGQPRGGGHPRNKDQGKPPREQTARRRAENRQQGTRPRERDPTRPRRSRPPSSSSSRTASTTQRSKHHAKGGRPWRTSRPSSASPPRP